MRIGLILGLILLLTGCATLKAPPPSANYQKQDWQQRRQALNQITHWNISGAFGIRQPQRNIIATYEWQQQQQSYHIHIFSSLAIYSANITGRPGYVTLSQSQNQHYSARSPEQLMQQQLGWRLPISNLYYWMRGLPAPGRYQANFDAYGHITALDQEGWHIDYENYLTVGHVDLPQRLVISRPGLSVKIVVSQWNF